MDLHVRRVDAEIYERLRAYRYDLIFADEPPREGGQEIKVISRGKMAADASVDNRPKPILHAPISHLDLAVGLIKKYPNRIRCVEVDLKELRELPDKVRAFKDLTKFSSWLLRRNVPLFFSSGATVAEDVVPPAVLDGLIELISPGAKGRKCYRLFLEFVKGVWYG